MKTAVTFVNTRTGSRADVRVGPDPLMLLAGLAAAVMLGVDWAGGPALAWPWYAGATVLVHARLRHHWLTLPTWGSLALGLMSSGMSMLITGVVVHRLIAQRYRDAGWKIRPGCAATPRPRFRSMTSDGYVTRSTSRSTTSRWQRSPIVIGPR